MEIQITTNTTISRHELYKMDDFSLIKKHKTIADVLTVQMAIKAGKSSKNHKIAPRSVKRDRTKTKESKKAALERRNSRMS